MSDPRDTQRLDKWLWQARFFKSRTFAAEIVSAGKVRVDGAPVAKPARAVGAGDVLTFPQGQRIRVVRICALASRRGPATEARTLYDDLTPPEEDKPARNPRYEGKGRPTGKERRNMARHGPPEDG